MFISVFKKLNLRFFYINVIAVLVFAFLYYIQDVLIFHNQELAKKLHLFDSNNSIRSYSNKVSPLSYYLWFSLSFAAKSGRIFFKLEIKSSSIDWKSILYSPLMASSKSSTVRIFSIGSNQSSPPSPCLCS